MDKNDELKLVALAGIPNVGKSTLFNQLTGLNQKIGNYSGVTVDKKLGKFRSSSQKQTTLIDLPGTYNIYPRSEDELVVFRVLCGLEKKHIPDAILAICDMSNLERSLFLATQLIDLGLPISLVLNMEDSAIDRGISVNTILLKRLLGVPVYKITATKNDDIAAVRSLIEEHDFSIGKNILNIADIVDPAALDEVRKVHNVKNDYQALHLLKFTDAGNELPIENQKELKEIASKYNFEALKVQRKETSLRYEKIREVIAKSVVRTDKKPPKLTSALDNIFLNKYSGFIIFTAILFLVFQAIFAWATIPMDAIDLLFSNLSRYVDEALPAGVLTRLLTEGIIPGIGGVVIFVPQIALLFGFLALLEGTGYMARAVFITDRLMRPFGLNGKSVVPLISGMACAIPAIMAARSIGNNKDRLITIFVTPFMSCSARLPVYIILIGIVVPDTSYGIFHLHGIALFGMYLLGILAALFSAVLLKGIMRSQTSGHLVIELPPYRLPRIKDVLLTMYEKSKTFVVEAGKVILAVSIVLWVAASYGPGDSMEQAANSVPKPAIETEENMSAYRGAIASKELEASYAGRLGHFIEPVIRPLGYDWKIGIALITSFAAREVFVSTIATLYTIGDNPEEFETIQDRLSKEINPETGKPFFTLAVGFSLLVFYAFAMQCMSTIAVVYRETKGWKWPIIQTVYMTALAYIGALIVYQILV